MNFSQRDLWKRNKALAVSLLFGCMGMPRLHAEDSNSWIESWQPTVSVRAGVFEKGKDASADKPVYPASLWVSARPSLPLGVHAFVEASSRVDSNQRKSATEIREGYLESSFGPVDLKLGRQVTVWGRADKLNPTDLLSSKDLRRLSSDDEDQRMGIGAAQTSWNIGDYRLIGVWQYEWRRPLFPILPPVPGIILNQEDPEHPDQQFAIKLDHSGGQMDWSLSGFDGYNRSPDIALREAGPEGVRLAMIHHKIRSIGGDLAFNAADVGWRAELAHVQTEDREANDPLQQNTSIFAVFGGDRNLIENLNVNLQLFARWVERDRGPEIVDPLLRALRNQLRTNAQQRHSYQDGLTLRLNFKAWQETLELETAMVWNRQDDDRILRPKLIYAWNDRLKTIVGAEIYRGSQESFFGQLRDFSGGFTEVRYSF